MAAVLGGPNPRRVRVRSRGRVAIATVPLVLLGFAGAGWAASSTPAPSSAPSKPMTAYVADPGPLAAPALARLPAGALAGGSSPSAAAQLGGGYDIAQRNLAGRLQVVGTNGVRTVFPVAIAPGTSPSIVGLYVGGPYAVALHGRSGTLMLAEPGGGVRNLNVSLAPSTSPSIGASAGGCCNIAFHGANGDLFVWTPATGPADTGSQMAAGSSPSIAEEANGAYAVAFRGTNGDLFVYTGPTAIDSRAQIAQQTNPSIAALVGGKAYEVAFASPAGRLSLFNTVSRHHVSTRHVIAPTTSPSIASLAGGGWVVAFAGRNSALLTETAGGRVRLTSRHITPGTSPAEAASPPILNPAGAAMFGVATNGAIVDESTATLTRDLGYARATGAKWLRVDINWAAVQARGRRSFNWTRTDRVIRQAEARGMKVLGTLIYTPPWAAAVHSCTLADCAPQPAAFAAFAHAAVAHYAPLGVGAYEIWSEENTTAQWLPRPSPSAYTALLRAAYPAIKHADPTATVLTGGTSPSLTDKVNYSPPAFLAALYRDGAGGSFDAVGVHPYCWPAYPGQAYTWSAWYQTYGASTSMRSLMVAHGDGSKLIWGTEFGAATYGPKGSYVGFAAQAQTIVRGFAVWSTYSWAGPLLVYEGRDQKSQAQRETMWNYLGLLLNNFVKKPSYASYQQAASLY